MRGLSSVVGIFLIILISLIAAGIFWAAIFGTINIFSDEIENSAEPYIQNKGQLNNSEINNEDDDDDDEQQVTSTVDQQRTNTAS